MAEIKKHADWAGALKIPPEVLAAGEDALKAWALDTMDAVRDLARPDLINWDAFVAQFQRLREREEAKKLTIDYAFNLLKAKGLIEKDTKEIRRTIAESLGLELPPLSLTATLEAEEGAGAKLVAAALGGQDALPVPARLTLSALPPGEAEKLMPALASGLSAAIASVDPGQEMARQWTASIAAQQQTFASTGQALGNAVAGAFLAAVLQGVGDVRSRLAALIAPEVARTLAAQQNGRRTLD
jgi:hypothetical protein